MPALFRCVHNYRRAAVALYVGMATRMLPIVQAEFVSELAWKTAPSAGHAIRVHQGIFRNNLKFLGPVNVDFLEENRLGTCGSGLHRFGRCFSPKILDETSSPSVRKCENRQVSLNRIQRTCPLGLFLVACLIAVSSVALFGSKSQDAARVGGVLFRDKGCAYCHGDTAQGTHRAPSLADTRTKLKAAQIATQIENGGQKMPSFKDSLSQDEVAKLVAFLRAKHKPFAPPASTPAQVPGSVSNPVQ